MGYSHTPQERAALEVLIPELAESEDEKIRKDIIKILNSLPGCYWHGQKEKDDCLAYLEKQKDSTSNNFDDVWNEEDCEEIIAEGQKLTPRFKELLKEVCHAWYDRGAKLEKQKEQNLIMANSPQLKEQKQEKFPPYVTGIKGDPDPAGVWKPSEEQMNALYDILHPADTVNRLALESLYEQLKAL